MMASRDALSWFTDELFRRCSPVRCSTLVLPMAKAREQSTWGV